MKLIKSFSLLFFCLVCISFTARADDAQDYKLFADEVRTSGYSMDLPEFEIKDIPEKYSGESAVFVAIYHELNARKKTGFGHLPGTIRFSAKARVEGGELCRMLIHINDKAALNKFAEFDFSTDMKKKMSNAHRKQRNVMGVRVIKPDGRVVDISTDDFVEVNDGKDGKDKRRKLAVPGLEIGDKIDVFFYTEHKLQNVHLEPMTYYLRDIYPILNYHIHAVVDDNLTTQYRTLNGAPDFVVGRDEDKNYVLDLKASDMPAEAGLWYNGAEQSPMVKLQVYNRRSDAYTPESARKDGLQANPSAAEIVNDVWSARSGLLFSGSRMVNDELKNGEKAYKNVSKLLKAGRIDTLQAGDYIYNLLTLAYFVSEGNMYPILFDCQFCGMLRYAVKDGVVSFQTSDIDEEPVDQLISMYNATSGTKLHDKRFYLPPRAIMSPSELHPDFIGRKAQAYYTQGYRKKHPEVDTVYFNLPETTPSENSNVTDMKVSIDGTILDISRRESYLGTTKNMAQFLLTEEDIVDAYLKYLNRFDIEVALKEKKKKAADRESRYATLKEERMDAFKSEVEGAHKDLSVEFVSGELEQVGVDPAESELIYKVDYKIDGLVKSAGKNMILSVGKLLGGQTELLQTDRKRSDDIVMSAPREFITRIEMNLPSGYRVSDKSLDALRRNVANECGEFNVVADVKDNKLQLTIIKRYNSRRLPAENWNDVTDIVDAASDWQSATLMLERE